MSPPVSLRPVTRELFEALVMLRGEPGEGDPPLFEPHVASVAYSLAQAYAEHEWHPRAICAGALPVGFCMWGHDRALDAPFITRLLVDHRRQGLGYGRRAMELLVEEIAASGARHVFVSLVPGNDRAERLYLSLGFVHTGETVAGAVPEPLLRKAL